MAITRTNTHLEIDSMNSHALISWRSIAAGLLISMFSMLGLLGLGLALGGINMSGDTSAQNAGVFTGAWFLVSTLISIFLGSYFAARVSKFRMGRIGSAQGLVIAALFLGFFLYQIFMAIGSAGSLAGSFLGKSGGMIAGGLERASESPQITATVGQFAEDSLGDLNFRSPPQIVAQGVASRIFRGDSEGAKNYLAMQAGISRTEANMRIDQMRQRFDQYIADAKEATGTAMKSTGWSLFLLVALGALFGTLGGALGSVANFRRPLISLNEGYFSKHQQV